VLHAPAANAHAMLPHDDMTQNEVTQAAITKAIAPMIALQAAITKAITPTITALNEVSKTAAMLTRATGPMRAMLNEMSKTADMLTRAGMSLLEQYGKSPKEKARRAHAALIAICQRVPRLLRKAAAHCQRAPRWLRVREIVAVCGEVLNTDTRPARHALLSRSRLANAPNWARSQIFDSYQQTRVAATN